MRVRERGKAIAKAITVMMDLLKEDTIIELTNTKPFDSDDARVVDVTMLSSKGVKYAILYPKSSWGIQRKEQANGAQAIEANVGDEGTKADSSNLRFDIEETS